MKTKPSPKDIEDRKASGLERLCTFIVLVSICASIFFVGRWSMDYPVKGVQIWVDILVSNTSFAVGYLLGQQK